MGTNPMSSSNQRRLLLLSTSVAALALAQGAYAQAVTAQAVTAKPAPAAPAAAPLTETPTATDAATGAIEAVVVTGSRLTGGFNAPTPVTVLGADQIQQRAQASIGELLNEVPTFRASTGPTVVTNNTVSSAQTLLDLRGLGATRTLVLVNGLRPTPVNATNGYDVNLIPASLVDRTEVVTGGASAAYGSDAVAGVVNFILKNHLEGFSGNVQYGESQRGDNKEPLASLAYGTSFAGGRGHFIIGGDLSKSTGVGNMYTRDWGRLEPGAFSLPTTRAAGLPANIISNNVELSSVSRYGIIPSGPLAGTVFNAQGQPSAFGYGPIRGATEMIGTANYGSTEYSFMDLAPSYQRAASLARVEFEFTPDITGFGELHYGSLTAHGHSGTCCNSVTYTIGRDNPFLPPATLAAMIANNLQTIQVGRRNPDYDGVTAGNTLQDWQGVVGLQGKLGGGWKWDATYTDGISVVKAAQQTNPKVADQQHSAYAVTNAQGQIVCGPIATDPYFLAQPASTRAALTAVTEGGCQPFNVFGAANNAAAVKYAVDASYQNMDVKQQTAAVNLSGEPFSLPAGPVSLAVGGEWRKNSVAATGCPDCLLGMLTNQNFPSYTGEVNVKEAYAETGIPVLRDRAFFKSLDLNGAVRETDYSTSGSVTTWKVGGDWAVNDDIRFRATRSRDIRAPNISELFNPGSNGRANLTNKLTGASDIIASTTAGNPNLKPEVADTLTLGVVLQPSWLSRFHASVDYFQINIADVIGSVAAQDVLDRYLLQGLQQYKPFIVFNNTPLGVAQVNSTYLNLAAQKSDGVDFEVSYHPPIDAVRIPGRLDVRVIGTWYDHLRTIQNLPGGGVSNVDTAGTAAATAHWQANINFTYGIGNLTTTLNGRYSSKIKYSATLVGPDDPSYNPASPNSINRNLWPSSLTWSLGAAYDIASGPDRRLQVYGVIDNLLDKNPPIVAISMLSGQPYDVIGRSFKAGVRFSY